MSDVNAAGEERAVGETGAAGGVTIRPISAADDEAMGMIARHNLKAFGLDIPGTAYFDPEIMHLSEFYGAAPERRSYFVALSEDGSLLGGGGLAEFEPLEGTAELQKLYLGDAAKGHGLGTRMVALIEDRARELGYTRLYLETHSALKVAIHLYEKLGYERIEPVSPSHATMDRFYIKAL